MNAIEIRNLTKNFGQKQALKGLDMTVPQGAIYGFIGENGSGKSTTEKIICGLIHKDGGSVKLYGKDHTDSDIRARMGVLIEAPGCFPNMSVWNNMKLQAANLDIADADREIVKILKMVRMEGAAGNKYTRIWFRRSTLFSSTAMSAVSNQGIATTKPQKDSAGSWLTIIVCKSLRM